MSKEIRNEDGVTGYTIDEAERRHTNQAIEANFKEVEANYGVREFETGATRSSSTGRYDPEGYLSPLALERFAEYMAKHQVQEDGTLRDSDNWQKGMPLDSFMKGMWRHFLHLWLRHRGHTPNDPKAGDTIEEDLCAIIFNAQAYLHTIVQEWDV